MRIAILDPASFVLPYDVFFAQGIVDAGHRVELFCSRTSYNEELLDELQSQNAVNAEAVKVHRFTVSKTTSRSRWHGLADYARMLVAVFRRRADFDLINMQFGIFLPFDLLFMIAIRRRVDLTVHDDVPHGFLGRRHWPTRLRAALARHLIFTSQAVRDRFIVRYAVPALAARSITLQHGSIAASLRPIPMQRPETAFLAPVVTFFGTVKPYKGVQQLIDVAAVRPGERIEIHGKWDRSLDDLQRLARSRAIVVRDEFIAPSALHALLSERRLFVLPYRSASQSGVLYLLLHYAKPFISTASGDLGDFLRREGMEDLIVDSEDPAELDRRIQYAKENYFLIEGKLQHIRQRYDWREIVQQCPLFTTT